MIIQTIFDVLASLILAFFELLPTFALPTSMSTGIASFFAYIDSVSAFVPVSTMMIALGTVVLFHNIHFLMSGVNWLIRKIPTIS